MAREIPRIASARLTILGSGTLFPDDDHRSAAHLVEFGSTSVLMDCGSGTLHACSRYDVRWQDLTHIVLTHFHTDHFADLAPLLFVLRHGLPTPRQRPLYVLGPRGLSGVLEGLAAAHGDFVRDPGFELVVEELGERDAWDADGTFTLRTHPTPHTEESVALRVDGPDWSIGYTGDTGPEPALGGFFEGCGVLVSECSLPDDLVGPNHLGPADVARLAVDAGPGLLVLTHVFPQLAASDVAAQVASAGWEGRTLVARDGDTVRLDGGAPGSVERR